MECGRLARHANTVSSRPMKPFILAASSILSAAAVIGLAGCASKTATTVAPPPTPAKAPVPTPTPRVMPAALKGQMMPGVWVLCYHRITDTPVRYTNLQPAEFRAQMNYLAEQNFNVVPLKEIVGRHAVWRPAARTYRRAYLRRWLQR